MKQVWILNHYALEPGGAGGTRHYHLAVNLPAYGWQATVIAASVELNSGRQRLAAHERLRLERFNDVPFLWIRTPEYQGNGIGRVLNMLMYTFRVLLPGYTKKLHRPDVIVGSSVHPLAALAGALLARRHKVPFVFEVRDLWPQTLIDLGRLKERSFITWLLRRLEQRLYREAGRIVVLLPHADDYIVPLGISAEKIVWIPNGVDLSAFSVADQLQRSGKKPFVLMYFGAHGQANGLDNVLRAMQLVAEQESCEAIKLRMIGDGPLKSELMQLAREFGLDNVSFEPPVPKEAIPELAAEADAFVFNLIDAPVFRFGISSNKLFDFMAGARPIIFCSDAANNPVEDAHAGITVLPGDPAALARAILTVSRMSIEDRQQMGRSARRYVEEEHDFSRLAGRLAATLDASTDGR